MVNSVTIVGRLGQDPEIKYFESGRPKAKFSLAVNRGYGENRTTDWFNVEVWGKKAEFAAEWLKKGKLVAVLGSVELNRWTDQAGNPRDFPVITANDIQFVGGKNESGVAEPATTF